MAKKEGRGKGKFTNLIIVVIIILSLMNIALFVYDLNAKEIKKEDIIVTQKAFPEFISTHNATLVSMKIPAVDENGVGLATSLIVEAVPGTGRTFVDIDNLLFWADTQQSIRTARRVAGNITGLDINSYDLIYNIHANATVIGGESAGAAITLATIAALEQKKINKEVMMTGTINHDGSIGPVSEILSKAKAAKEAGATTFLVPLLQSRDVVYEISRHCEKFGPTEVCTIEQIPKKISVNEETGIEVTEVGSVKDAAKYFFME